MQTRGLAAEDSVEGGNMGSLRGLYLTIKTGSIFLNFGS